MQLPDPNVTPILSVPEAGRLLGVSKDTAYRAAHAGQIPVFRVGKKMVVPTARLLEMLSAPVAS